MKERCIICTKETPFSKEDHIDFRDWYIVGMGQLCKSCYEGSADTTDICIPGQMVKETPNDMELGRKIRTLFSIKKPFWR